MPNAPAGQRSSSVQTRISYNSVTILDVLTDGISHVPEYESGVHQVGVRVRASFTGNVHTSNQDLHGKRSPRAALGDGLNVLLKDLTIGRRPFLLTIGTSVVYDVRPGAVAPNAPRGAVTADLEKMDIDNGPKPQVEILKITSGTSATIRFTIEFVVPNCGGGYAKNTTGLVNFHFWIAEDIDCRTWLTTRTYTGRLRVAHKGISAQSLARQIAIPPQQRGVKRSVAQLAESEDGLHLDFTVVDQEIIAAPPWSPNGKYGAVEWDGIHQMSTQAGGAVTVSDITLRLVGPKGTSKEDLFTLALRVVEAKTHFFALLKNNNSVYLEHFGMKDVLKDNDIEVGLRMRYTGSESYALAIWGLGGRFDMGKPIGDLGIGFDDQVAFQPGQSATLTGLFLSVLQTPCAPATMPQIRDTPVKEYEPKYKPGAKKIEPEGAVEKYPAEQPSPGHLSAMYLDYAIESDLIVNSGKLALPTGAASNSNSPSLAVIQLYRPTAMREIRLEATRVGKPPELPAPNTNFTDSNGIVHTQIGDANIVPTVPQLSADARRLLYGASMQIRYAMSRPPRIGESVSIGCLPYRTSSPGDSSRRLPADIFVNPAKLLT